MRERFDAEFRALLDRDNPDARSIWTFVERTIRQYGLHTYGTNADEILSETYSRGIRCIVEQGKPIDNPLGWIRLTAYNVIREMSRTRRRCVSYESIVAVEFSLVSPGAMDSLVEQEEIDEDIQALQDALKQLAPKDREVLQWRHISGLSWWEVGERLADNGEKGLSEATLRQQGYRALVRLRKLFHSLRSKDPGNWAA